jgi:Acyclic terpene utilisation family protein AtuA
VSGSSLRILSGTGILGYGFDPASVEVDGLDLVACDGGSTDGGPYYLGSGSGMVSPEAARRDLEALWGCARRNGCPLVVGSCGAGGSDAQLEATLALLEDIAAANRWQAKVALVRAEVGADVVLTALDEGRIAPLDGAPRLDAETVRGAQTIVAMMGTEPIVAALETGADVILAGRISDAAIFAALPIMRGFDAGVAWHAGKLLECGAACAQPPGQDCIVAEVETDKFTIYAPNPARRCTPESIMTFTLHETPDPFLHPECGGTLDLTDARAVAAGDGRVEVTGARFVPRPPTVRLEGATQVGHRTVLFGATRDPRLVASIEAYLARVLEQCHAKMAAAGIGPDRFDVNLSVYGRDGVLGPLERERNGAHELAVLFEVIAATPEISRAVATACRSPLLHTDFPGRQCSEGNFALPFSPPELDGGPAYRFSIWHSMEIDGPLEFFPVELRAVGA